MLTARRVNDDAIVIATNTTKAEGPFHCTCCDEAVILKRGEVIAHHFSHKHNSTCAYSKGETEYHYLTKLRLAEVLQGAGFEDVQIERNLNGVRPDVSGLMPDGKRRVAIELQRSYLAPDEIERRNATYHRRGYYILWLNLYEQARLHDLDRVPVDSRIAKLYDTYTRHYFYNPKCEPGQRVHSFIEKPAYGVKSQKLVVFRAFIPQPECNLLEFTPWRFCQQQPTRILERYLIDKDVAAHYSKVAAEQQAAEAKAKKEAEQGFYRQKANQRSARLARRAARIWRNKSVTAQEQRLRQVETKQAALLFSQLGFERQVAILRQAPPWYSVHYLHKLSAAQVGALLPNLTDPSLRGLLFFSQTQSGAFDLWPVLELERKLALIHQMNDSTRDPILMTVAKSSSRFAELLNALSDVETAAQWFYKCVPTSAHHAILKLVEPEQRFYILFNLPDKREDLLLPEYFVPELESVDVIWMLEDVSEAKRMECLRALPRTMQLELRKKLYEDEYPLSEALQRAIKQVEAEEQQARLLAAGEKIKRIFYAWELWYRTGGNGYYLGSRISDHPSTPHSFSCSVLLYRDRHTQLWKVKLEINGTELWPRKMYDNEEQARHAAWADVAPRLAGTGCFVFPEVVAQVAPQARPQRPQAPPKATPQAGTQDAPPVRIYRACEVVALPRSCLL